MYNASPWGQVMKIRTVVLIKALLLLGVISAVTAAQAPQNGVSHFTNINVPGAQQTSVYAVNDTGVVAGSFIDSSGNQHGMILHGTKVLFQLDYDLCTTTPPFSTTVFGLNNSNRAVGWCLGSSGSAVAFEFYKNTFTPIVFPKSVATEAFGINDKGQIVGNYIDPAGAQHGFLLSGGRYQTIDIPNFFSTTLWSINNYEFITAEAIDSAGLTHSFLRYPTGRFRQVDVPQAGNSFVHGLDNYSPPDLIYGATNSSGTYEGALFLDLRSFVKFEDQKGPHSTQGFGINKGLKIVGNYVPGQSKKPSSANSQGYSAIGCCRK